MKVCCDGQNQFIDMKVNLHIEKLILDGVEVQTLDHPALQAAVEAELTRLLTQGTLHPDLVGGGARPFVRGGAVQVSAGGPPGPLGQQIAQAVYKGIGK